jgi:hypothetical protein
MEQEEQARKDKMAAQAAKLAELQEAKRKKEEEKEEKEEDGEEKKRREEEQQKVIIPPNKPDGPGISPLTPSSPVYYKNVQMNICIGKKIALQRKSQL